MEQHKAIKIIISGGGTGGHIFPAISIADKLKELNSDNQILFVGAEGKMEMEKVPAAGYKIKGLPIVGIQRKLTIKNIINDIKVPFKILKSLNKADSIVKEFHPDLVIGVGGYASGPLLWAATRRKIPTLIQEQNGFAGLANKILSKKVDKICVAYNGMERFFPAEKIIKTGNPIRKDLSQPFDLQRKIEGIDFYGLDKEKKYIFIVGGSLGSNTLNQAMIKWIKEGCIGGENIEIIWQCGKYYKNSIDEFMKEAKEQNMGGDNLKRIHYFDFIKRMDLAYAVADLVIARSGASTVSELCALHKATIFVPSPNVAEDHQTHNAMALVSQNAASIIKDNEAVEKLIPKAIYLLTDSKSINEMEKNIAKFALPDAALVIAEEGYKLIENK